MGLHYVPRKYLEGFCEPGSDRMLWQYDKQRDCFARVSINTAANEAGFYPPEVEMQLANDVEAPANRVIGKLRVGHAASSKERAHLSFYIATMLKRVPASRKLGRDLLPNALQEIVQEVKDLIVRMGNDCLIDSNVQARRLAEADEAAKKLSKQPPPEALKSINSPWPSEEMIASIYIMTWRFMTTSGPSYFLTSDNPVFFFRCFGLKGDEAELVFPISSDLLLHGCWQPSRPNEKQLFKAPQQLVKEFNRRIANAATRFVFFRQHAEWIRTVAQKTDPYLSKIRW
jgi:hypothetical protein